MWVMGIIFGFFIRLGGDWGDGDGCRGGGCRVRGRSCRIRLYVYELMEGRGVADSVGW